MTADESDRTSPRRAGIFYCVQLPKRANKQPGNISGKRKQGDNTNNANRKNDNAYDERSIDYLGFLLFARKDRKDKPDSANTQSHIWSKDHAQGEAKDKACDQPEYAYNDRYDSHKNPFYLAIEISTSITMAIATPLICAVSMYITVVIINKSQPFCK